MKDQCVSCIPGLLGGARQNTLKQDLFKRKHRPFSPFPVAMQEQLKVTDSGSGVKVQTDRPHLVSLGGGRLSVGITILPIHQGRTTVGCINKGTPKPDIVVEGTGVEPTHCYLTSEDDVVTLHPISQLITVDGRKITYPTRLSQGCMLCIGRSNYFRFNHPQEAKRMRDAVGNHRISHAFIPTIEEDTGETKCRPIGEENECVCGEATVVFAKEKPYYATHNDDIKDKHFRDSLDSTPFVNKVSKFEFLTHSDTSPQTSPPTRSFTQTQSPSWSARSVSSQSSSDSVVTPVSPLSPITPKPYTNKPQFYREASNFNHQQKSSTLPTNSSNTSSSSPVNAQQSSSSRDVRSPQTARDITASIIAAARSPTGCGTPKQDEPIDIDRFIFEQNQKAALIKSQQTSYYDNYDNVPTSPVEGASNSTHGIYDNIENYKPHIKKAAPTPPPRNASKHIFFNSSQNFNSNDDTYQVPVKSPPIKSPPPTGPKPKITQLRTGPKETNTSDRHITNSVNKIELKQPPSPSPRQPPSPTPRQQAPSPTPRQQSTRQAPSPTPRQPPSPASSKSDLRRPPSPAPPIQNKQQTITSKGDIRLQTTSRDPLVKTPDSDASDSTPDSDSVWVTRTTTNIKSQSADSKSSTTLKSPQQTPDKNPFYNADGTDGIKVSTTITPLRLSDSEKSKLSEKYGAKPTVRSPSPIFNSSKTTRESASTDSTSSLLSSGSRSSGGSASGDHGNPFDEKKKKRQAPPPPAKLDLTKADFNRSRSPVPPPSSDSERVKDKPPKSDTLPRSLRKAPDSPRSVRKVPGSPKALRKLLDLPKSLIKRPESPEPGSDRERERRSPSPFKSHKGEKVFKSNTAVTNLVLPDFEPSDSESDCKKSKESLNILIPPAPSSRVCSSDDSIGTPSGLAAWRTSPSYHDYDEVPIYDEVPATKSKPKSVKQKAPSPPEKVTLPPEEPKPETPERLRLEDKAKQEKLAKRKLPDLPKDVKPGPVEASAPKSTQLVQQALKITNEKRDSFDKKQVEQADVGVLFKKVDVKTYNNNNQSEEPIYKEVNKASKTKFQNETNLSKKPIKTDKNDNEVIKSQTFKSTDKSANSVISPQEKSKNVKFASNDPNGGSPRSVKFADNSANSKKMQSGSGKPPSFGIRVLPPTEGILRNARDFSNEHKALNGNGDVSPSTTDSMSLDDLDLDDLTSSQQELKKLHRRVKEERKKEQEEAVAEQQRLEDILMMCADYEKQLETECTSPPPDNKRDSRNSMTKIKTNGSLTKLTSPSQQHKDVSSFDYSKFRPNSSSASEEDSTSESGTIKRRPNGALESATNYQTTNYSNDSNGYYSHSSSFSPGANGPSYSSTEYAKNSLQQKELELQRALESMNMSLSFDSSMDVTSPQSAPSDILTPISALSDPMSPFSAGSRRSKEVTTPSSGIDVCTPPSSGIDASDYSINHHECDSDLRAKLEKLKKIKQESAQVIGRLKHKVKDIEMQQTETVREMEMERALLEGERQEELEHYQHEKQRVKVSKQKQLELMDGSSADRQRDMERIEKEGRKLAALERTHTAVEEQLECCTDKDEEERLLEQIRVLQEQIENQRKIYEDLEFQQLEVEAKYDEEREAQQLQLQQDTELLVKSVREREIRIKEIEAQEKKMVEQVKSDIGAYEDEKQKLFEQFRRERDKLIEVEHEIRDIHKVIAGSPGAESNIIKDLQLEDEFFTTKTTEDYIREARESINKPNGRDINCASFHSVESEESSLTSSETQSDKEASLSSGDDHIERYLQQGGHGQMDRVSYLQQQVPLKMKESELALQLERQKRKELEARLQEEIHRREDLIESIKFRDNTKKQARPMTRYLPVREKEEFDLRQHVEQAGHSIDACPFIFFDRTSCRGYLQKMGAKFKTWNKRWFVFDRIKRSLVYYSDKSESKPRGGIYFQSIQDIYVDHLRNVKNPNFKLTFCVKTHDRTYYFVAPSPEAMRIWIDVLWTGAEGYQEFLKLS